MINIDQAIDHTELFSKINQVKYLQRHIKSVLDKKLCNQYMRSGDFMSQKRMIHDIKYRYQNQFIVNN